MSSHKTVKFEISLEKLTVKFEGDVQIAERLQGEITGALNTLASAQQRMLAPPAKPAPAIPSVIVSERRRRRRRKPAAEGGIDPAILDGDVEPGAEDGNADATEGREARRPRRPGAGPQALLTTLKNEGFFSEKRTNAMIRAALATKGHMLKSNELNPALVSMTQKGLLRREQASDGQWTYFDS